MTKQGLTVCKSFFGLTRYRDEDGLVSFLEIRFGFEPTLVVIFVQLQ